MTVSTVRCDLCGLPVSGLVDPEREDDTVSEARAGVRFSYHPGDVALRDDSGLACRSCWQSWTEPLGRPGAAAACSVCDVPLSRTDSLFLRPVGAERAWQLCSTHAAELLNGLLTVEPKLDPATFRLPHQGRGPSS